MQTIAVSAVLAAYNWPADHPRRAKLTRFIDRFYANFDRLLEPPFHPKWQEVDLKAEVARMATHCAGRQGRGGSRVAACDEALSSGRCADGGGQMSNRSKAAGRGVAGRRRRGGRIATALTALLIRLRRSSPFRRGSGR